MALARALVLNPDILLLDEPLSNLDAKIRVQVRAEIRTLQQELGITTVYVTHDQEEALSLSDRVAVMRDGRVQQVAVAQGALRAAGRPLRGRLRRDQQLHPGRLPRGEARPRRRGDGRSAPCGPRRRRAVAPASAACWRCARRTSRSARGAENAFEGRVVLASYLGSTLRYDVETAAGLVLKVDVRRPVAPRGAAGRARRCACASRRRRR